MKRKIAITVGAVGAAVLLGAGAFFAVTSHPTSQPTAQHPASTPKVTAPAPPAATQPVPPTPTQPTTPTPSEPLKPPPNAKPVAQGVFMTVAGVRVLPPPSPGTSKLLAVDVTFYNQNRVATGFGYPYFTLSDQAGTIQPNLSSGGTIPARGTLDTHLDFLIAVPGHYTLAYPATFAQWELDVTP